MVNKKLLVTYDGDIVAGATDISFSRAIDFKGNCSFVLPNFYGAAYTTWKNREDTQFKVYLDLDDGDEREDKLLFSGFISTINATHPLRIEGMGWIEKTTWIAVREEDSKFISKP